ncbi:Adaptive-response sensory-kinase SasA [subsurface metagenome]
MGRQLVGANTDQSELNRRTRLLNSLIWLLMGALGLFLVYVLATGMQSWISGLISFVAALIVSGIGYWLARSGRFYAAVYLFLSGFVVLLLFVVFMGGRTAFSISEQTGLGWGVVATAVMISFVLACMSWLFGESINSAFSALKKRSEELQTSHEELKAANTELQTKEKALADEATRRRILIDQSRDGIVVLGENGEVYEANQKFAEMLRCTPEEAAKLHVWDWEYLYPREQVIEMIKGVDATGDHFETQHRRKDGSVYDVDISTNGAVCAGQKLIFCVCRDITERKTMEKQLQEKNEELDAQNEELKATEEELRASNEELQAAHDTLLETQEQLIRSEKLAAIGQLASGVGHELRNPLGAIKNAGFYIRRRLTNTNLPNTEPRVMEFLSIIEEEVNSANKVITDLLGFSRLAKPTAAPANIAGIIEDALRYTPVPENVELIKDINNNLPMVMVDGDQVKQVFLNIILNALQAMSQGGRLEIRAIDKGKSVDVEFIDTGGGIPDSVKKKIFDPLFTTKAKGVGLGLSVCKTIIERHEGDIKVKSKVGEGTTFTISLPTKKILETSAITKGGNDGQDQHLSS